MLGRPASWAPVWKKVTAGSWLIASVCIDLMKHSSSATLAVCGSSSLTRRPRSGRAGRTGTGWPRPGSSSCREVMPVSRWPIRIESGSSVPWSRSSSGLVVEQVHLRRCARLEQVDHPLRPGGEVGEARDARAGERADVRRDPPRRVAVEQRRQGDRAQAQAAGPAEEVPARQVLAEFDAAGPRARYSLVIVSSRFRISCADRGVGRQLARVEARVAGRFAGMRSVRRRRRGSRRKRASWSAKPVEQDGQLLGPRPPRRSRRGTPRRAAPRASLRVRACIRSAKARAAST